MFLIPPSRTSSPRRRSRSFASQRRLVCQSLETRQLLAGDVDVFTRRGDVFVVGDSDSNSVELRVESTGELVAVGLDGTTINGSAAPFVVSENGQIDDDLRIRLGGGDDQILLDGLSINDDLLINGGRGDDAIGLLRVDVGDDAQIFGMSGELDFSLDLSTVGDDLRVVGSRYDDTIVFDGSLVSGYTFVNTSSGDDTLLVLESEHQGRVVVTTGRGDDTVGVVGSTLGDDVYALLGSGNDALQIEDSSLGDRVIALGGSGQDALALVGDVELNPRRTPLIISFESDVVDDFEGTVDAAIAELVDSGARRPTLVDIAGGSDDFSILVGLLVQSGLIDAVSGTVPLTVFAPTNEAFEAFISEFGLMVKEDGTLDVSNELLTSVLLFHVAAGNVDSNVVLGSSSIATLLPEEAIRVDTTPGADLLDGRADLLAFDIRARNGIIHVIDAVLTPSSLDA